jgi:hypothetical protein
MTDMQTEPFELTTPDKHVIRGTHWLPLGNVVGFMVWANTTVDMPDSRSWLPHAVLLLSRMTTGVTAPTPRNSATSQITVAGNC